MRRRWLYCIYIVSSHLVLQICMKDDKVSLAFCFAFTNMFWRILSLNSLISVCEQFNFALMMQVLFWYITVNLQFLFLPLLLTLDRLQCFYYLNVNALSLWTLKLNLGPVFLTRTVTDCRVIEPHLLWFLPFKPPFEPTDITTKTNQRHQNSLFLTNKVTLFIVKMNSLVWRQLWFCSWGQRFFSTV